MLAFYTKEEEAFILDVVHDILMYGANPVGLSKVSSMLHSYGFLPSTEEDLFEYSNRAFDRAAPTSLFGSWVLAYLSWIMIQTADAFHLVQTKFDMQALGASVLPIELYSVD